MTIDPGTLVGAIVNERLGRWKVFEEFGIDYCCGGAKSLAAACREAECDPQEVMRALARSDAEADPVADTTDWNVATLSDLTEHIDSTHHAFMKQALPRLDDLMAKVLAAHGQNHPELVETAHVYDALRAEITDHLAKEEQVLFPMIRRMEAAQAAVGFHCGSITAPIGVMEHEHDNAGEALRRLRRLTNDYTPPSDACTTYRALLAGLAEMEQDLHVHIHKENNILHPRATRLEAALAPATAGRGKGAD